MKYLLNSSQNIVYSKKNIETKYQFSGIEWTEISSCSRMFYFFSYRKSPLFYSLQFGCVSFTNLLGRMAKISSNDRTTIGLNSMLIETETIVGATIIPKRLIASMIPAAVDWIWTEKDSVCKQTIKV